MITTEVHAAENVDKTGEKAQGTPEDIFSNLVETKKPSKLAQTLERIRDVFENKMLGVSLEEIVYRKMSDEDKKVVDNAANLTANPGETFKTKEEIVQAVKLIKFPRDINISTDFISTESRAILLERIKSSSDLIRETIISSDGKQFLANLCWLMSKPISKTWSAENFKHEEKLIGEIELQFLDVEIEQFNKFLNVDIKKNKNAPGFIDIGNIETSSHHFKRLLNKNILNQEQIFLVIESLVGYVRSMFEDIRIWNGTSVFREIADEIAIFGSKDQKAQFGSALLSYVVKKHEEKDYKYFDRPNFVHTWLLDKPLDKNSLVLELKISLLRQVLESKGLDAEKIMTVWQENSDSLANYEMRKMKPEKAKEKMRQDSYSVESTKHLKSLLELESEIPDICKSLNAEFGINFFGRYKKETLIRQYQEKDIINCQYGTYVSARYDDNGALDQAADLIEEMAGDLDNIRLRIFEVENKKELLHMINKLRHRYGKLSFLVIHGHGNFDGVKLGHEEDAMIMRSDFKRSGSPALNLAFIDDAIIIFNSCETGKWGGIAQLVSKKLKMVSYGPRNPSALKKINVNRHEGQLLKPHYHSGLASKFFTDKKLPYDN